MSEDTGLHVGDVGALIEGTIKDAAGNPEDISATSLRQFKLYTPIGTEMVKTATFSTDGTDGKLRYMTITDDLSVDGTWSIRAYLEFGGGWEGHTGRATFEVYPVGQ